MGKKKKAEEERRKAMQEGFEKCQAMLAAATEARQAMEKAVADNTALLAKLKAEKEAMGKGAAALKGLEEGKKKTKHCFSVFGGKKKKAMALEAEVVEMKADIKSLKLQIASLDKKGYQLMKLKKNLWLEVGDLQGSIATKLERGKSWDSKYKLFMFENVMGVE